MPQLLSIQDLMPGVVSLSGTWHPRLARPFERYATARTHAWRARRVGAQTEPHWLLLPQWLMQQHRRKERADSRFLKDILRGQFCAFLGIKLQDELFDQQVSDRSLIYVADYLLLSAREAFGPHFSATSALWPFFNSSLKDTINAIIHWDQAQLHGFGPVSSVKAMTSAGYAVCNLATFAVCLRLKKLRLFQALLSCTDEIAFVGQLLDDLEDIEPDFARGRLNYAARFLLNRPLKSSTDLKQRLASSIVVDGKLGEFLRMLGRHLDRAANVAASVKLPGLLEYITRHRKVLESLDSQQHKTRVGLLFGKHI
jgi:hypothetical protein